MTQSAAGLFRLDRDAETSPKRLLLLIGVGAALVLGTLWAFSGDEQTVAVSSAPPAPPAAPAPAPAPPPAQTQAQPAASAAGLELHGVMGYGNDGAAIISVGGRQRLVRVGRDVMPGLPLQSVAADHVILLERGTPVRLAFPDAPLAQAGQGGAAPPRRAQLSPDRQRQIIENQAGLTRQSVPGRVGGYAIRAGAVPPQLERAGLRAGDVVLRVGGTQLESGDDVERIPREMSGTGNIEIEFVRDGRMQRVSVPRQ